MKLICLSSTGGSVYVNPEMVQAVVSDRERSGCVVVLPDSEYSIDMSAETVVTLLTEN